MEPLQAIPYCVSRRITRQSLGRILRSKCSNELRHDSRQLKGVLASAPRRALSATSSRWQTPQDPQAPQPELNTTARPSWPQLLQGRVTQETTPRPSPFNLSKINEHLKKNTATIDLVSPRQRSDAPRPSSSTPSQASSPNGLGVMKDLNQRIRDSAGKATHDAAQSAHLRLTPMLGRTLSIDPGPGRDLQSAFRVLESRCIQNRVKRDSIDQRTHVRRGLRKKQLKSERWRALFKQGFINEVARIRRMKRQGW